MPNQMIALQARNPQIADPSRVTAQYANMMNMSRQAEAAQLQGARTRQEMEYAKAAEGRAVETQTSAQKKAAIEYVGLVADQFSRDVGKLKEGDIAGAEALRADIVGLIPAWGNYIRPASEWTQDYRVQLMLKGKEIADKTIPDVVASREYAGPGAFDAQGNPIPENTVIDTRIGGFTGAAGSTPLRASGANTPAPRATPTATPETAPSAGPVANGKYGEARVAPDGGQLDEFQRDHVRRMKEGLGMTNTPASFTGGGMGAGQMTPEVMSRIADSAFQTGVIAQVDFDQLLATQPPENRQAFTDAFRRANITLQADAPSLADSGMGQQQMAANPVQTPQAGFADFRGPAPQSRTANLGGDMSMMRDTEAQYIPVQRRDPNMAPYPASAQVPLRRVAGEAAAQEGGKQGVRVKAEPAIAGATKTAELRAQKDASFSDAQSQFDAAYTTVKNRLSDIKRFRAHPAANRVIGPIDAFTPNFGRARGAQEIYRSMVAAATFDALQEMRTNSPTGGALGNVSDTDIRLLKESIGALGQAQDEKDFYESLDIYEDRLNQVLGRLEKRFRESYGYRLGSGWKPAEVATKRRTPTTGGRKAGAFTITEVDE